MIRAKDTAYYRRKKSDCCEQGGIAKQLFNQRAADEETVACLGTKPPPTGCATNIWRGGSDDQLTLLFLFDV
jgi:hypothetical protein